MSGSGPSGPLVSLFNPLPTIVICSGFCLICTFVPYNANNMDSTRSDFSLRSSLISRVRTDLEKSFNLTLVMENWNLKIVPFVLELSWNLAKLPLETWVGPGKLKQQQQFSRFMELCP